MFWKKTVQLIALCSTGEVRTILYMSIEYCMQPSKLRVSPNKQNWKYINGFICREMSITLRCLTYYVITGFLNGCIQQALRRSDKPSEEMYKAVANLVGGLSN